MVIPFSSNQGSRGLSLVELMISTAIVGLLSSVAIPSYNRYVAEAKLSEGVRYMGELRHEQEEAYVRSQLTGDLTPRYADRFVSLQTTHMAMGFRVSGGAKFDAIVGTNAASSGFLPGESVAQTDLADTVFSSEFVTGQYTNRNAGFGTWTRPDGSPDYVMAVVGDVDGDPDFTMFVATRKQPLILACDDFGQGIPTQEWAAATAAGGGSGPGQVTPNCTAYDGGGCMGGSCGGP